MNIVNPYRQRGKSKPTGSKKQAKKGLSARKVDDYLRFMLFLAVIGMAYIWNGHYAERQVKLMEVYQKDVKSLKSRYLLKESTLGAGTRLSEVQSMVDTLGLRPMKEPPFKIEKGKELAIEPIKREPRASEMVQHAELNR